MKRPSFQFYPGDWQANSNLRRCTRIEKSVWLDVLCLMHDQEEYGVLRWTLKEIAEAAHCKISELKSLIDKGVLKGADKGQTCDSYIYTPRSGRRDGDPVELLPEQQGPIWYSSRFVRDEYLRTVRGCGTRFGDAPNDSPELPFGDEDNPSPIPPLGDGASSSSSSSKKHLSSVKPDDTFDRFWSAWPSSDRKTAKAKCAERWSKARLSGEVDAIVAHVEASKVMNRQWRDGFEPAPLTYLNQRRWEDGEGEPSNDLPFAEAL